MPLTPAILAAPPLGVKPGDGPTLSPSWFARRRVLVMGLGLHGGGLAVAKWLFKYAANVRVTDLKDAAALAPSLRRLPRGRRPTLVLGRHRPQDFRWAEVVVQNPAVPRESPYLALARRAGARMENEATLFFQLVGRGRIIGVTGTRGKSTTAALAAAVLRAKFPDTLLGGNLASAPMFSIVERALARRAPVVLELSSWHLENLGEQGISPHVAVVTNVLPDHLNRYRSMASYAAAKRQIVGNQEGGNCAILNADNAPARAFAAATRATVVTFSRAGRGRPPRAFANRGWLRWEFGRHTERIAPLGELRLPGAHNVENMLAALAVGKMYGVPTADCRAALARFRGLPYRLQFVAVKRGIRYVNDTTATTPEASLAAIATIVERWPSASGHIVLIAGGSDKRLPREGFALLARQIAAHGKAVVLFTGSGSDKIVDALRQRRSRLPVVAGVRSMAGAVAAARAFARRGDVVLLSPACASFGLFFHEFDRGDQFNQCVRRLPT